MADLTLGYIEQIKKDATEVTRRRLQEDGVDFHAERNAQVNAMEGVTGGTPVLQAAKVNPSDPGLDNFQTLASHSGPKNVHAASPSGGTASAQASARQANESGMNTTPGSSNKADK